MAIASWNSTAPGSSGQHRRVLRAMARLGTAALGGHRDRCDQCAQPTLSLRQLSRSALPEVSDRGAERVGGGARAGLLPVGYVHIVFTMPEPLARLALVNKRVVYDRLFQAAADTLLQVARNPKRLGGNIGGLMVLHTWGQRLQRHPHVHCVVPAGRLSPDGKGGCTRGRVSSSRSCGCGRSFGASSSQALREAFRQGRLVFPGQPRHRSPTAGPSARSCDRSIGNRGWSTPSRPSAARPTCCTTSRATRTASPSPITGW